MRCRKAQELISLYVIPDQSWLSPEDCQALRSHMAACVPCREDCQESREAMDILQQCWQVSEDTEALLENRRQGHRHGVSVRIMKLHGVSRRVAIWAVAACLAIAVLGLLFLTGVIHVPDQYSLTEIR